VAGQHPSAVERHGARADRGARAEHPGGESPPPFFGTAGSPAAITPAAVVANEDDEVSPAFDLSIEAAERDQIRKALEAAGGKRMEAARLLGLSRRTLYRKLDKYGIT